MCPLILCFFQHFAVSRILSSLYRFNDVFDVQLAVVDAGINFFLVSYNTFLIICCLCVLEIWFILSKLSNTFSKYDGLGLWRVSVCLYVS